MPFHKSLIPNDLKHITNTVGTEKDLLRNILELSREIVSLREDKEVVNNILATAAGIAGAERSAIFILDKKIDPPDLYLRAAQNLTAVDIEEKTFETSMVMIRQTAQNNRGRIYS